METDTQNKPKGRRSYTKDADKRMTGRIDPYAYTITDPLFGEFTVLNTANAWWLDKIKVVKIFDAYKFDCTDLEAKAYAGVTEMQFRYFRDLHPDFYRVKEACMQNLGLIARKKFAEAINRGEGGAILTYLRKKHKAEFNGTLPQGGNMPGLPGAEGQPVDNSNTVVFVDFSDGEDDDSDLALPAPTDVTPTDHAAS